MIDSNSDPRRSKNGVLTERPCRRVSSMQRSTASSAPRFDGTTSFFRSRRPPGKAAGGLEMHTLVRDRHTGTLELGFSVIPQPSLDILVFSSFSCLFTSPLGRYHLPAASRRGTACIATHLSAAGGFLVPIYECYDDVATGLRMNTHTGRTRGSMRGRAAGGRRPKL